MLSNFYPYLVENGFNQKLLFCTSHDAHAQSQQHEDTLNSVCAHKEEEENPEIKSTTLSAVTPNLMVFREG